MSSRRKKEEEYDSDEDDDFVPDAGDDDEINVSDDEDNEGIVVNKGAEKSKKRAKKSTAAPRAKPKRRGPFDSDDESEEEVQPEEAADDSDQDAPPAKRSKQQEEGEKKKVEAPTKESNEADAFFAAMMKGRPSTTTSSNTGASNKLGVPASWLTSDTATSITEHKDENSDAKAAVESKRIVVKQRYEFAGEKIEIESEINEKEAALLQAKKSASGLGGILDQLKGKNKISTLQKTKLDWNQFTTEEGLEDEFTQNRKDGYIQKKEFLQNAEAAETAAYIAGRSRANR